MPNGDRTGPAGTGPMTGRGAGFCAGFAAAGYANPVGGRGMGMQGCGGGRGRGRRNRFFARGVPGWTQGVWGATGVPAMSETDALKQQAECLQNSLSQINKRIQEIQGK